MFWAVGMSRVGVLKEGRALSPWKLEVVRHGMGTQSREPRTEGWLEGPYLSQVEGGRVKYLPVASFTKTYGPYVCDLITRTKEGVHACKGS